METNKPVTLLLIRHGQAQSNVLKILTSYPEAQPMPLSDQGRKEVRKTAEELRGTHVDALFASPLTRTQETAALISEAVGVPVTTEHRLRETDFGMYNNTSYTKFFLKYPHPNLRNSMSTETKAEGLLDVRKRAQEFLQFLQVHFAGKTVILVTHADVIREIVTLINPQERRWSSVPTGSMKKMILS